MALGGIRSLWDIPGLERVKKVCSTQGVHFTAYGGLVRHLLLKLIETANSGDRWDLFDIVPFASDIDLIHTGTPEQTQLLQRALVYEVPFGECFRWQLRSVHDNALYWDSMKVNNVVPASLMTLSTNSNEGIYDRWDAYRDYSSRKFRYIRNGFYSESPLFKAGKDLELFSALLYYRVLFEAGLHPDELEGQPGLPDARAVMVDGCRGQDTQTRLEESAYLRARLRYLCAALGASARPGYLDAAKETLALDELLEYLGGYLGIDDILFPESTLTIAAHLKGDSFRLPFSTGNWMDADAAQTRFDEVLKALAGVGQQARLGPGQKVLFASPEHYIELGISSSSHAGSDWLHEFVHFALPLIPDISSQVSPYLPDGLAVLASFCVTSGSTEDTDSDEADEENEGSKTEESSRTILVPVPSAVQLGDEGLDSKQRNLFIRVNCGGLFEATPALESALRGDITVQFFLVGWKGFK